MFHSSSINGFVFIILLYIFLNLDIHIKIRILIRIIYVLKFTTMTRRKIGENNIRSLTRGSGGNSYSLIIPVEYIRKLKWRAKQKLDVQLVGDHIIIRDWKS